MKKIYFLVLALFFFNGLSAQIINFPDANFKAKLLLADDVNVLIAKDEFDNYIKIDSNKDNEIDVIEASMVASLYVDSATISSVEGISNFTNLTEFGCSFNSISTLDLTSLLKLKKLYCSYNQLTSLDINHLINLQEVILNNNQVTTLNVDKLSHLEILFFFDNKVKTLDISKLENLIGVECSNNKLSEINTGSLKKLNFFYCNNNQLKTVDFSASSTLNSFTCNNNPELNSVFIKNGSKEEYLQLSGNPNLKYICADDSQILEIKEIVTQYNYANCEINSYCSFSPGGVSYTINGNNRIDSDSNGCDVSDLPAQNIKFSIFNGIETGTLITNNSGNYSIKVQEGNHTISPIIENPDYYSIFPNSVDVTFPSNANMLIQDFCITPIGSRSDLEINLIPLGVARPGFSTEYKLVFRNKGNVVQSGTVNLDFQDKILDFITANPTVTHQSTNNLSWSFANLKPFETREIAFFLKVNTPTETPAVNNGDILKFIATIASQETDETPIDNTFNLNQTVVGSYDPNDKTCLEGSVITPNLIGQYVHYLIRFENTGTYPAQNIVVKDMIDLSKFDILTLIPTSSSHSYITKISEGNKVEFIFENVNLPFDDNNNDGYIAFKIKTKPTLAVGDSFDNEANIYFDYNFPVLTNKATSTFKTTLDTSDFEFSNYFSVYPNPAHEVLNIATKKDIEIQSIAVYDILGQLVIALPNIKDASKIDVSNLRTGNYFIKIKSDKGSSNVKFIKN